ncbi:GlmU family protein [Thermonema rossianum]|uniref:GlmU family protein n=1 Tax=Thermonema rossianum TaxID=55505 RepID=UPI0005707F33|nr:GlmU family protein [Thermonema rossianum]
MHIVLFDTPEAHRALLPLTFTRATADLRVGALTIAEKWQRLLRVQKVYRRTPAYMQPLYEVPGTAEETLYIAGNLLPDAALIQAIEALAPGEGLVQNNKLLAMRATTFLHDQPLEPSHATEWTGTCMFLQMPADVFRFNGEQIRFDFDLLACTAKPIAVTDPHTVIYGKDNVLVEEGARLRACVINAEDGPVYIGRGAQVQEMSVIHGAFALCEGAVVNIGGKMRGDTTIGPYCKVGGEVSNSVFWGYSNKAHDGFVGNSVIGAWCNLGADTNTSNLKNNYSTVRVWSYLHNDYIDTGLQFCGLTMGDHAKAGINTMFNTGTVVGVAANIFGGDFPPKHIPSFSWGGAHYGWQLYRLEELFRTAGRMMQRRGKQLSEAEKQVLTYLYEQSRQTKPKEV